MGAGAPRGTCVAKVSGTGHAAVLDLAGLVDGVLADALWQAVPSDEREALHGCDPSGARIVQVFAGGGVSLTEQGHIPAVGLLQGTAGVAFQSGRCGEGRLEFCY